ncbi:uncharacterized protein LOC130923799 isoform X2 [Corythoichthys intestinalis]|uniref:uncharacterized protein LOC130923799 isoform X2 n=1 Tax=Corythoichthys intestinalis TaxID=161448 RepID=UPI0025A5CF63|nr:uncharacterized protein LOC130923799 isoform X2 [Corythoichthys intestinalis]
MYITHFNIFLVVFCSGCSSGPNFKIESKVVGEQVFLNCAWDNLNSKDVFWMRLASGAFPEFLTPSTTNLIEIKRGKSQCLLQITKVQKSDMAVYYCLHWKPLINPLIFLQGIFLQVRDVQSEVDRPAPTVTLQCMVLSRSRDETCADKHKVYWVKAGTKDAKPRFISAHEECGKVGNGKMQNCVYTNNITFSDDGTSICAVETCGEIFMGNATPIISRDTHTCDSQRVPTYVLGAILTFSLLLSAFFVYKIKTKRCSNCKVCPQSLDEAPNQVQQRNEDSLVYSAPIIVSGKRGKLKQADGEFSTYTDVCLRKL